MVKIMRLLNSALVISSHSIGDVAGDGYGAGDNYSIIGRELRGAPAPTQQSNANYSIVPGAGFSITSDSVVSTAGYRNSFGMYFLDGSAHPISGVVVFANVKETLGKGKSITTNFTTKDIPSGAVEFGFFLIPNGHRLNRKLVNGAKVTFAQNGKRRWAAFQGKTELRGALGAPAFFSLAKLNPDKRNHMRKKGKGNVGFEDVLGGGDNDFNDAILHLTVKGYGSQTVSDGVGGVASGALELNPNYSIIYGAGFSITSDSVVSTATYQNSFGMYFLNGSGHPISGVVVFANVKEGKSITTNFTKKDIPSDAVEFGFFIIPNGHRLNRKLVNGAKVTFAQNRRRRWAAFQGRTELHGAQEAPAYFSLANLNPDKRNHVKTNDKGKIEFEDKLWGGDNDFNDARINVTVEGYGSTQSEYVATELGCQNPIYSNGYKTNVLPSQPEFSWTCHDLLRYYSHTHNIVLKPCHIKLRLNGVATVHTCESYGKKKPLCIGSKCHNLEYCKPN